jgi:peroxiredoxin
MKQLFQEDQMKRFGFAMLAVVMTAGLGFFSAARADDAEAAIGKEAPAFSLQDQNGKTVNLSDYKGKIVVLEWWNNECPVVQRHYKANTMNSMADKYSSKDVVWIAINSTNGKTNDNNKAAGSEMGITSRPILNDSDGKVGKAYGAKSTPHMFIIDKEGKLAYMGGIDNDPQGDKKEGVVNYVDKALTELLNGQPVSEPKTKQYGCGVKYAK